MTRIAIVAAALALSTLAGSAAAQPKPSAAGPVMAYGGPSGRLELAVGKAALSALGALGALVGLAEGKDLAQTLGLVDPSQAMAGELAANLAHGRGGLAADAPLVLDPRSKGALTAPGARFIVLVGPTRAEISYFPTDWGRYTLNLHTSLHVGEAANGRLVLKDRCTGTVTKGPDAPTFAQLMEDGGARLKAMLKATQSACLARFQRKLFDLPD